MADSFPAALENALKNIQAPVQAIAQTTSAISAGVASAAQSLTDMAQGIQNLGSPSTGSNQSAGENQSRLRAIGESSFALADKVKNVAITAANTFKSAFIDPAVKLEQFQLQLEAVEGSSEETKKSMEWLSNFSIKSPIDGDAINDAFLKLRTKGIDPTNGLMQTLSDTSLATGNDLARTAEAFNNAIGGDSSALANLGIQSHSEGDTITYEYVTKNKEKKTVEVDKNNTKQMQQALAQILDDKYSGATDRFSKSWGGMMTNLSNHFANFKSMLMGAGVFDFLKEKLGEFQSQIAKLAASGELKKFVDDFAKGFIAGMQVFWEFVKVFATVVGTLLKGINTVVQAIGGWEVVFKGLAILIAGSVVLSVISFGKSMVLAGKNAYDSAKSGFDLAGRNIRIMNRSMRRASRRALPQFITKMKAASIATMNFATKSVKAASSSMLSFAKSPVSSTVSGVKKMGTAMLSLAGGAIKKLVLGLRALGLAMVTNPVGLLVAAIAIAAAMIYKFWEPIKAFTGGVIEGFKTAAQPIIDAFKPLQPVFSAIGDAVGWVVDKFMGLFEPVQSTTEGLNNAAESGRKFGEWLGKALGFLLAPITAVIEGVQWLINNFGKFGDIADAVGDKAGKAWDSAKNGVSSLWDSIVGEDDKEISATSKITKNVEQTGKVIPFPNQQSKSLEQGANTQNNFTPLKPTSTQTNNSSVNASIVVNATPGMSEEEIARQIKVFLQEKEKEAKTQQRTALYDYQEYAIS